MSTIGVIDYGMGNLHSLCSALTRVAPEWRIEISSDPETLARSNKLVVPGVGGVRHCMEELQRLELVDFVRDSVGQIPMIGICLGMQIMLEFSEENNGVDALGLFDGQVSAFAESRAQTLNPARKVPHMGWNKVDFNRDHPLLRGISSDTWFYFVHSYFAKPRDERDVLGTSEYEEKFASVLLRDGVFATQFHPEKSQAGGMQMLSNFVTWDGEA